MAFVAYLLENAILMLFDLGPFNTFIVAATGRKNGFAAKLLSANLLQKSANWEVNLCKGGKCNICIPISTRGCRQVSKFGIYHLCTDLFLSFHFFASYLRSANLEQIHFFVR